MMVRLILAAFVGLAGCSQDATSDAPASSSIDARPQTGPDAAPGATPVVTKVSWTPPQPCTVGTAGPFTITVTATDSDTPTDQLTISGMTPHCAPLTFSTSPATITCPNALPYTGNQVTVSDPQGHVSDPVMFTMSPCQAGSAP